MTLIINYITIIKKPRTSQPATIKPILQKNTLTLQYFVGRDHIFIFNWELITYFNCHFHDLLY